MSEDKNRPARKQRYIFSRLEFRFWPRSNSLSKLQGSMHTFEERLGTNTPQQAGRGSTIHLIPVIIYPSSFIHPSPSHGKSFLHLHKDMQVSARERALNLSRREKRTQRSLARWWWEKRYQSTTPPSVVERELARVSQFNFVAL